MITKYFFPHVGRVERHVQMVCDELGRRGIKFTVLTEKFNKDLKSIDIQDKVKVVRFNYPPVKFVGIIYIWLWLIKNSYLIKEADLVHIHDVFIWYLPLRFLFPWKPVYITFHGYPSFPLSRKAVFYQRIAERLTKGNICVGDFIGKWFGTTPTIVTYGGVDIRKSLGSKFTLNSSKIVFVGRLSKQVGALVFKRMVDIFKERKISLEAVAVGDGDLRNELTNDGIKCRGVVSDPYPFIRKSTFVFATGYLSVLEAFACRKLVFVAFEDPLREDYLKMTPFSKWMVISNDPEELADKVEYYIKNPEKVQKKINAAYRWVKKQTWNKMADNYEKLWGLR